MLHRRQPAAAILVLLGTCGIVFAQLTPDVSTNLLSHVGVWKSHTEGCGAFESMDNQLQYAPGAVDCQNYIAGPISEFVTENSTQLRLSFEKTAQSFGVSEDFVAILGSFIDEDGNQHHNRLEVVDANSLAVASGDPGQCTRLTHTAGVSAVVVRELRSVTGADGRTNTTCVQTSFPAESTTNGVSQWSIEYDAPTRTTNITRFSPDSNFTASYKNTADLLHTTNTLTMRIGKAGDLVERRDDFGFFTLEASQLASCALLEVGPLHSHLPSCKAVHEPQVVNRVHTHLALPLVNGRIGDKYFVVGDDTCNVQFPLTDMSCTTVQLPDRCEQVCEHGFNFKSTYWAACNASAPIVTLPSGDTVVTVDVSYRYRDYVRTPWQGTPFTYREGVARDSITFSVDVGVESGPELGDASLSTMVLTSAATESSPSGASITTRLTVVLTTPVDVNVDLQRAVTSSDPNVTAWVDGSISSRHCDSPVTCRQVFLIVLETDEEICRFQSSGVQLGVSGSYGVDGVQGVQGDVGYNLFLTSPVSQFLDGRCTPLSREGYFATLAATNGDILISPDVAGLIVFDAEAFDRQSSQAVMSQVDLFQVAVIAEEESCEDATRSPMYSSATGVWQHGGLHGVSATPSLAHSVTLEMDQQLALILGARQHNAKVCSWITLRVGLGVGSRRLRHDRVRGTSSVSLLELFSTSKLTLSTVPEEPADVKESNVWGLVIGSVLGALVVLVAALACCVCHMRQSSSNAGKTTQAVNHRGVGGAGARAGGHVGVAGPEMKGHGPVQGEAIRF